MSGRITLDQGLFGTKVKVEEIFSNKKLEVANKLEDLKIIIEMETETGKTYIYTKTMYEFNKHYCWNRFIMVPSVAITRGA